MPKLIVTAQTPLTPLTNVSELVTFLEEQYEPEQALGSLLYDPEYDAFEVNELYPVLCGSKLCLASKIDIECIIANEEGRSNIGVYDKFDDDGEAEADEDNPLPSEGEAAAS